MTAVEEALVEIDGLLAWHAQQRIGQQSWLLDDVIQEARIAAWTRLEEGHPIGIAVHNAKQAMIDVLRGSRMTGSKQAGVAIGAHERAIPFVVPSGSDSDEYVIEPADPRAEDEYQNVDLAAFLQPLSDEQRSAVLGRLAGLTTREIGSRDGVSHQAVSLRLKRAGEILYGKKAS